LVVGRDGGDAAEISVFDAVGVSFECDDLGVVDEAVDHGGGHDVVAAAMIDRLVHHAEVVALKGDSYRIKDRDLGRVPTVTADDQ